MDPPAGIFCNQLSVASNVTQELDIPVARSRTSNATDLLRPSNQGARFLESHWTLTETKPAFFEGHPLASIANQDMVHHIDI